MSISCKGQRGLKGRGTDSRGLKEPEVFRELCPSCLFQEIGTVMSLAEPSVPSPQTRLPSTVPHHSKCHHSVL